MCEKRTCRGGWSRAFLRSGTSSGTDSGQPLLRRCCLSLREAADVNAAVLQPDVKHLPKAALVTFLHNLYAATISDLGFTPIQ